MTNKRILYLSSTSIFAVLLIALFLPTDTAGRILAAILLVPSAFLLFIFNKKRNFHSINTRTVTLIITVIALVLVMLYYLSGLRFGFYKNPYTLTFTNIFKFSLPIAAIIISSEIIRYVIISVEDKKANTLSYLICVIAEMLTYSSIPHITSFNRFMELVAITLFPAIIANTLYQYVSRRYGMLPNIIYRLLTTLYLYLMPIRVKVSDSLLAFIKLFIPLLIYLFISALYEKRRRLALEKKSKLTVPITIVAVAIMTFVIMLVSNHFYLGSLVIATESMTGEINKGDVVIFQRYDEQLITEGQVIVFESDDSMIVHRVAEIKIINGNTIYYTKGDANDNLDIGFITDDDIVGLVNHKIPYIGFPSLWLRSLFDH